MIHDMQRMIEKVQKERRIEYYDFSTDPDFKEKINLFANSDHLSKEGIHLFSLKLKDEIGLSAKQRII